MVPARPSLLEPVEGRRSIFSTRSHQKVQDALSKQVRDRDEYIAKLQALLREHDIDIPELEIAPLLPPLPPIEKAPEISDASEEQLKRLLQQQKQHVRPLDITLEYSHLTYRVYVAQNREIPSVSSLMKSLLCFWTKFARKKEIKILSDVTGRIKPRKMTLLIGPPGSGKSGRSLFNVLVLFYDNKCFFFRTSLMTSFDEDIDWSTPPHPWRKIGRGCFLSR